MTPPIRLACAAFILVACTAAVGCSGSPVEEHANYVVSNDFLRDFAIGFNGDDGPTRERLVKDAGDRVAEELRGAGMPSRASMEVVMPVLVRLLQTETKPAMLTALLTAVGEYRQFGKEHAKAVEPFAKHENEDIRNLATYVLARLKSATDIPSDGG